VEIPQSTYRGRVEIGGVNLPPQLDHMVHHNFVHDGRYSERGLGVHRAPPPPLARLACFYLHDSKYTRKRPLPLYVYSVGDTAFAGALCNPYLGTVLLLWVVGCGWGVGGGGWGGDEETVHTVKLKEYTHMRYEWNQHWAHENGTHYTQDMMFLRVGGGRHHGVMLVVCLEGFL
jgi:hypothetical protein